MSALNVPTESESSGLGNHPEATEVKQVKQTIQVPCALWSRLEERSRKTGITKSEALRRAIWLFATLADRMDEGDEVVIHRHDGKEERLLISPY